MLTSLFPQKLIEPLDSPKCVMLIGLPGGGKTTWRNQEYLPRTTTPTTVICVDDYLLSIARERNTTYDEIYNEHAPADLINYVNTKIAEAAESNNDIVIDHCNFTKKQRSRYLRLIPRHYYLWSVSSTVQSSAVLKERHEKQKQEEGKTTEWAYIEELIQQYEPPSTHYEFDLLYHQIF